jgi:hypothetical protein
MEFDTVSSKSGFTYYTANYSLLNETTGEYLFKNQPVPKDLSGKYLRNWTYELLDKGFVLSFRNEFPTINDTHANSGWNKNVKTNFGTELAASSEDVIYPISFVVEFGDTNEVLDSAFTSPRATTIRPVNFKVYESETEKPLDFWISENFSSQNGRIDPRELIIILYKRKPNDKSYQRGWNLKFTEPVDPNNISLPPERWIMPQPGDKYYAINKIPFNKTDVYRFKSFKGGRLERVSSSVLEKIKVVPNPYIVSSILERQSHLQGRGERFIRFINLPAPCTIRIFTVSGDFITRLESFDADAGTIRWDIRSSDGLEVSFGLYIYHVAAPGIGEYIGKFAIIN